LQFFFLIFDSTSLTKLWRSSTRSFMNVTTPKKVTNLLVLFLDFGFRVDKKLSKINFFPIPRLNPFLTSKKRAVGIFGFARCVDWGFHKKLNPDKENRGVGYFFIGKS
jgi:hypothetical protein